MIPGGDMDRWLSPAQASKYLGVSTRTLVRWEDRGRLRSARTPSGHRRYRLSELRRLLQERRRR
jgi:excisionase family DNA binding protein